MKKQKTFIKTSLLFFAVMLTAQSCGGGQPRENIELNWWKPFDDPSVVEPLIQDFQKANPGVRVNYSKKNIETYEDELIGALAAGAGPDIFSIHNDWLPKHMDKMSPAGSTGLTLRELREDFAAVASADLVSEEKVYAVPLSVDVLSLYYNRDILSSAGIARPPSTWEELVNLTPRLTRVDGLGNFTRSAVAMGAADNVNRAPDILGLLMLQNGTPFYTPAAGGRGGGTGSIDGRVQDEITGQNYSPAARALEFYTQFSNPAKVSYTWNSRSNNSIEAFTAGQTAMIFSYSYLRPALSERAPFLNYAVAPAPQISAEGTRVNFANYWAEGVSKQSQHQEAAWKFLKFITSKAVLQKYYEAQKLPSSRIDILDQQLSDPDIGVFAEQVLSARSYYKPQSDAVENIFAQAINDVVLRNISAQEAISSAAQKMQLLLRSY